MEIINREKIIWHLDILPPSTRKALKYLAEAGWLSRSRWYLAGGTALALQAGHRSSRDLDFFYPTKDFSAEKLLIQFPKKIWTADIVREGTIYGNLLGARVSFIAYPFFVARQPLKHFGAVRFLDSRDIAVMKIIAISQRGRKRDFIDLYWYCLRQESLGCILQRLPDQYPTVAHDFHHIIKSLTYFDDAEADPMPKIFFKASWRSVKKFFKTEAPKVAREFLGLREGAK